jgi:hypothetical protein
MVRRASTFPDSRAVLRIARALLPLAALALVGLAAAPSLRAEEAVQKRFAEGLTFVYAPEDGALADKLWPNLIADREAIMARLELYPPGTLRVVLAPTLAAFHEASLPGTPAEALGVYYPELHTILLRSPRTDPAGAWDLRGVARHELAHGVLHLALPVAIPRWLDEGLAILMADELSFLDDSQLTLLAFAGRLLPLRELIEGFPEGHGATSLAYAQAASLVRHLLARGGIEGIRRLLDAMARGAPLAEAIHVTRGIGEAELEREWQESLAGRFSVWSLVTTTSVLGGVGAPLAIWAAWRRRRVQRARLAQWAAEETRQAERLARMEHARQLAAQREAAQGPGSHCDPARLN